MELDDQAIEDCADEFEKFLRRHHEKLPLSYLIGIIEAVKYKLLSDVER